MKKEILGVWFDDLTQEEAAQRGKELLEENQFHYVVTPNPEFLLAVEKDPEFCRILNEADLVLPDGIGVVYSAKILGTPLKERVPGIEFAEDMLNCLNEMGGRLYLLGAKPGVAEEAGKRIQSRYPNLVLCGTHDGYFKDEQAVLLDVAAARPDLLFVCLGAPKQEKWMARWGKHTGARLAIGLGGCLDVFAGNVERAPEAWRKLGLEWAYRLKKEPRRIGRMAKLPLVLVKAAGQRAGQRKKAGENK
ncbi:MAG: WecB/TagA/CpsF family glycosyltransferase [Lawsonibacter sp.]